MSIDNKNVTTSKSKKAEISATTLKNTVNEFATTSETITEVIYTQPIKPLRLTGSETIDELLKRAEVSQFEEVEKEQVCLEVGQPDNMATLGTLGNFSLILGKAKSRKTFFHSFFLGAWINKGVLKGIFKASPPHDQNICLYFDTEQSRYHVQRVLKRVLRLARLQTSPNFITYHLRDYDTATRLKVIDYAINNTSNIGLVVIDGIRDLVIDINSMEEATKIATCLLKWTSETNIHIACILHENKNGNEARGNLGTELQNKAETVITVTKEDEQSIVAPKYCRDKDFEPFAFIINEDGLPEPTDYTPKQNTPKPDRETPTSLSIEIKKEALRIAFKLEPKQKRATLLNNLQLSFEGMGYRFGLVKLRTFLQDYENTRMIVKEGKTPHTFFSINVL